MGEGVVVEIDQLLVLDVLLLLNGWSNCVAGSLLVASAHTASRWRSVVGD